MIPAGGVEGLVGALHSAATKAGVEFKHASPVDRIQVNGDENGLRVSGVQLADGEIVSSTRVVSSADPKKTFLDLVGVENLEIDFTNRIRRLRCDGHVAKLHLALDGLPHFNGVDKPDGRLIIAPEMDAIEFAFDDAKYGQCSQNPVMEIVIPSLHDSTAAPEGQHVLSAHVMYVPYELKGGWTDAARSEIAQRSIDTIAAYAPGLKEQVLHAELLTPRDLEQSHHVSGGHWHHAELSADQMFMMRPTYEAAQYATPIPGLYLCGAGTHPGGGLAGAPGHNAAKEILK
jgi:phytoene dehydrogenase-like protein